MRNLVETTFLRIIAVSLFAVFPLFIFSQPSMPRTPDHPILAGHIQDLPPMHGGDTSEKSSITKRNFRRSEIGTNHEYFDQGIQRDAGVTV